MNEGKIAVRYAKALLSIALDKGKLDPVRNDMEAILQIVKDVPEMQYVLFSPVIEPSKKNSIIEGVFGGKVDPLTLGFLRMTIMNKREEFIPSMARMYIEFYKEEKGIKSVTVTTAIRLNEKERTSIIKIVEDTYKAQVELQENVNEKLIGGFVLKIEDTQMDASVTGQLKKIRQDLLSIPLVKTEKK